MASLRPEPDGAALRIGAQAPFAAPAAAGLAAASPFDLDPRRVVAVFRSPVFNASETFVRGQATRLSRYQPLIVGLEHKGHVPAALDGRILLARGLHERAALKLLGGCRGLAGRVRTVRPALVHAHFGPDGLLALPLARALGVPLVTTLRGYDVCRTPAGLLCSGRLSWMAYALRWRSLARHGDLFLAVSEAMRRKAIDRGFPADRLHLLYNGVELDLFPAAAGDDGRTILHVARLVEKKGTRLLIRAFAALSGDFPEARLAIIGDGPLRRPLERLSGSLGLAGRILFLGQRPQPAVAQWMRRAALLAAPSLTAADGDAEGLPNTVVEAMASGLPIVASDHMGIPEAVADGCNGFLVPEGDTRLLAHRIAILLGSAELRRRMGAAGRALAEQRFDAARQTRLLEDHYDALLGAGARTRINAIEALRGRE